MRGVGRPRRRRLPRSCTRTPTHAYTIVELVLVVALMGLLAAIAAPRFFDRRDLDQRRFASNVASALRQARRVAVASGCLVQARFSGGAIELSQQTSCSGSVFGVPVVDPATGAASYVRTAPPGVALSSDVDPLRFDALGRAVDGAGTVSDAQVSAGSLRVVVVGETGLVREP